MTLATERWRASQQQRLGDILRGVWRPINGEAPLATRAFEAARRAALHPAHLADAEEALDIYPSWYEGTPAAQVLEGVEALANTVERIARVHRAPRPTGYRHDGGEAARAIDQITSRCGWYHREWDNDKSIAGPRWGRLEGDVRDYDEVRVGAGQVVGPLAAPHYADSWQVTAQVVVVDRLPVGVAVVR